MANNASFFNWKWVKQHVSGNVSDGKHLIPDSTVVLAGPALLDHIGGSLDAEDKSALYPIAATSNVSINQQRQTAPLFEMGALRAYVVPGKIAYNATLTGFMLYGPSLARSLYALQPNPDKSGGSALDGVKAPDAYSSYFPTSYQLNAGNSGASKVGADGKHLNRDYYSTLASELMRVPFGMCIIFRNSSDDGYGGVYLEECIISSMSTQFGAGDNFLMENITIDFSLLVPVDVTNLSNATPTS